MLTGTFRFVVWQMRFVDCSLNAFEHKSNLDSVRVKKHTPNLTFRKVAGVELSIIEDVVVQKLFLLDSSSTELLFTIKSLSCNFIYIAVLRCDLSLKLTRLQYYVLNTTTQE
jgi:hypothetical protein